jgi:hypothetical protein
MKTRRAFLTSLSLAGIAGIAGGIGAQESGCPKCAAGLVPQPGEPLAIQYTKRTRKKLWALRETQSENLLEASYAIARTVKNKGVCWSSWDMGHSIAADMIPDRNGEPEIFRVGLDMAKAKKGDLFLANIWEGSREEMAKKELFIIGGPAPWGLDAKRADLIVRDSAKLSMRPYSQIWIDIDISTIDGEIYVPGMPAPIGPFSGAIGMTSYWMMLADACRVLAREGLSVKVKGDEPPLSGRKDVVRTGLNEPIMDEYFDTLMLQIEMIGMEMGDIRKIAGMAVDALLGGGKVWCYSRYYDSLSIEATTRRSGLALTKGTHDGDPKFKGSPKDFVIMGFYRPDDPVDLKHFDEFRALGMKIASIGPATRDVAVPEGRTIPKESDVHVGRMTDTYGMFAIPGFERKVCPTSGVLMNQIFWAVCLEIIEQTIRRTNGNVPGAFFSAAIKDGTEHMLRMQELARERGY